MDNDIKCFYFGIQAGTGHYLYAKNHRVDDRHLPDDFPVAPYILDGGLLPPMLPKEEGRAELIHLRNWTILTFWDNSFDKRPGAASSTFLIRGLADFEKAVDIAKAYYPQIWDRFKFEVKQRWL